MFEGYFATGSHLFSDYHILSVSGLFFHRMSHRGQHYCPRPPGFEGTAFRREFYFQLPLLVATLHFPFQAGLIPYKMLAAAVNASNRRDGIGTWNMTSHIEKYLVFDVIRMGKQSSKISEEQKFIWCKCERKSMTRTTGEGGCLRSGVEGKGTFGSERI